MAISVVGTSSSVGSGTSLGPVPKPSGVATDDFLVWTMANQNAGAIPLPSGWTHLGNGEGTALGGLVCWRWADASEPADYTNPSMPNGKSCSCISAYRGVDKTNPFDTTVPNPTLNFTAGAEEIVLPSIITQSANAWVISAAMGCTANGVGSFFFVSSNMDAIDVQSGTSAGGANVGSAIFHEARPSAGAFGPSITTSPVPNRHVGVTFALKEASGTTPPTVDTSKFFSFL